MIARPSSPRPPHGIAPRRVATCDKPCPPDLGRAGEPCEEQAGHVERSGTAHIIPARKGRIVFCSHPCDPTLPCPGHLDGKPLPGATWRDLAPAGERAAASAHLTAHLAVDVRVNIAREIATWSDAEVQLVLDLVRLGSPLEVLRGQRVRVLEVLTHPRDHLAPNTVPNTTSAEWARSGALELWRALDTLRGRKLLGARGSVHASIAQVDGEEPGK